MKTAPILAIGLATLLAALLAACGKPAENQPAPQVADPAGPSVAATMPETGAPAAEGALPGAPGTGFPADPANPEPALADGALTATPPATVNAATVPAEGPAATP